MALTKLDVSSIKDGKDGHVITCDATAKATTTGPGTSGHVLTSQGAGAEPQFAEIVSDAAAMALALG